ncbi:hypothetical protein PIB30_107355, partial [Stylosanthes scabra]|nr:hypothetical protein [Stylosanthes scabra]
MHQTVLKSEPPRSANRRPKLLPSSLSFMFNSPFFQFFGNFSDDYFRHYIHQNVPLSVTIPMDQTVPQSDTGRSSTRLQKLLRSSSSTDSPDPSGTVESPQINVRECATSPIRITSLLILATVRFSFEINGLDSSG